MTNRIKLPPKRRKPPVRKQATPGHRNIAYLRVSTALQDADNQKLGIVEYTYAEGLQPVEFIEETTSGKTPISERKLQQVIDSMVQGDTLIVSELSRLGRNMVEVMMVLDLLIKKGCKVHAVKGGYRIDQSLSSKILSMVLSMVAEIEREQISQRTKEALARRKAEGKPLGRPKGSVMVCRSWISMRMRFGSCYRMVSLRLRLPGCMAALGRRFMHGCGGEGWKSVKG